MGAADLSGHAPISANGGIALASDSHAVRRRELCRTAPGEARI